MTVNREFFIRLGKYLIGIIILAIGVSLAVSSKLGVSALTALPYVLSVITKLEFGAVTGIMFCVYVLIEWLILGKEFKAVQLLQVPCAILFGYLVSMTGRLLSFWHPAKYYECFITLLISIIMTGVGISIYLSAKFIPQAADGLVQAIAYKLGKELSFAKNLFDIAAVVLAALVSVAFLGRIEGVREGTFLAAVGVGRVIALTKRVIQ